MTKNMLWGHYVTIVPIASFVNYVTRIVPVRKVRKSQTVTCASIANIVAFAVFVTQFALQGELSMLWVQLFTALFHLLTKKQKKKSTMTSNQPGNGSRNTSDDFFKDTQDCKNVDTSKSVCSEWWDLAALCLHIYIYIYINMITPLAGSEWWKQSTLSSMKRTIT